MVDLVAGELNGFTSNHLEYASDSIKNHRPNNGLSKSLGNLDHARSGCAQG